MVYQKKINVPENSVDFSSSSLAPILKYCSPSEQYVLVEKYGIVSGKSLPMQQIWKKFDMSRERIRQILAKSLTKFRRFLNQFPEFENIIKKAISILKEHNSILEEKELINLLLDNELWLNYNELLLLLSSDYDLYYIHRNKRFKKFFYVDPAFEDLINDIHDSIYSLIEKEKKALHYDVIFYKIKSLFSEKFQRNQSVRKLIMNEGFLENIIKISRHLYTMDELVGLESDPMVNPKTIKLKMIYVLSKKWKPMHYEQIAQAIKERFNLKSVKVATIHNELVKNKEFVNVGLGMYGLASWGYNAENTLDLIVNILKKANRPMKVSEITKEVLKERLVKEVTVLLVLQKHNNLFERVGRWVYKLKWS